ncbi:uncharacterized protein LOC144883391 [Branchiostoma floridae x Branchiostoma japonicum]
MKLFTEAKALLDILPTRGPNAFAVFRDALKHRYPHLARILNDEGQQGPPEAPRVFIIHAGEDKESVVRPLVATLQQQGLAEKDIFFDDVSIKPGEVIRDRIISTLSSQSLELAVVVVSTSFLNKPYWPRLEYETCLKNNKRIFPIWVDANKDNFKAFSELVGKYSPTLKQMSARRVQRDDVTDELTNIAEEVVQRLSTLRSGIRPPAAIQTLVYLTPSNSPSPSDSGSSDEETRTTDQDMQATGVSDEQWVEDRLKAEKARQLDLLGKLGSIQLDLLKKAEGLLSREETEKQTKEVLSQLFKSGINILETKMGCAILHLLPISQSSLDSFWTAYRSGQLSAVFTDRLITDEMRRLAGQDLAIRVIMLEEQYRQWSEYFKAGDMAQTVQEFQSLPMTPADSWTSPAVSATTWESYAEEYLAADPEQVKLLLDSAWRDPVVDLVVLIPFFWPHIITYWLERNHTFPQTLTDLLKYSLCKHFAMQTGIASEQQCASFSETTAKSLISLGSKGLGSIVERNCREIDLSADDRDSLDREVFGLLKLTETKMFTFVNTFLHDYCVALYIKDALDRITDTAVLWQQLVQNAGRMPLVCFFVSGLLSDRAGGFLSALVNDGEFSSPFEKVEACLIALAETNHVQSLYPCMESVFDGNVLDVSSEIVLSLLFSSAAIRFINQSHVVQSVRLCDRSKLKERESTILTELEANPDEESVWLSSDVWSDVSDRKFILLLLQCIPLLSAVKKAGSKSEEPIMSKTPLQRILIAMLSQGTINDDQLFQLIQAMKHMVSLTSLDLGRCNHVNDDLIHHISPGTKYCSTSKLTTSPVMMLMSSLPRLACLQDLVLDDCTFLSATEVSVLCDSIKGSWSLVKLSITVRPAEWNDMMGAAMGKLFLGLPNLKDLMISHYGQRESETVLSHAVEHLGALRKLQTLVIRVKMSDDDAKALAVSLQHSECLEKFNLMKCGVNDTRCTAIAEAFVNMGSLKTLDLCSNQISLFGAKSFAAHVGHLVCLENLDLSRNKLSDDACIVITEAFHKMRSIKRLHLGSNNISVSGAKSFAAHVGNLVCLEYLDLSSNKLSDDGVILIADAFHKMKSVRDLRLSFNDISDRGDTVLMGEINFLTNLHHIDLHENKLTDAVAQLVVDTVKGMEGRWHVDLSYNCFSDEGVEILKQCHHIWSDDQHPERYLRRLNPLERRTLFHKGTEGQTSRLSKPFAPHGVESRSKVMKVKHEFHTVDPEESMQEEAEVAETSQSSKS